MTPPSWAYPYATVWDDFTSGPESMENAIADSGQTWLRPQDGMTFGPGLNPALLAMERFLPDWRGLEGQGRTSVMGWPSDDPPYVAPTGDVLSIVNYIEVPGATSENVYLKADVFMPSFVDPAGSSSNHTGLDIEGIAATAQFLITDGYFFNRWRVGYDSNVEDGDLQFIEALVGGPFPGTISGGVEPRALVASTGILNPADIYNAWHSIELRVQAGQVSTYWDGALLMRGATAVPVFGDVFVTAAAYIFNTFVTPPVPDWQFAHGVRAFIDHFQAGPAIGPIPVPVLAAAPGPQAVVFEPPRIT